MAGRFVAPFLGGAFLNLANFTYLYLTCAITGIIALVMSLLIPWKESRPVAAIRSAGRKDVALPFVGGKGPAHHDYVF